MVLEVLISIVFAASPVPIDSVCAGIENAHQCNAAIEASQLSLWKHRVSRTNAQLTFVLDSGELLELVDDNKYFYRFRQCIDRVNKCIAVKGANEYIRYITVDNSSGEQHIYRALPVFSPDGQSLVVGSKHGIFIEGFLIIHDATTNAVRFELTQRQLRDMNDKYGVCSDSYWAGAADIAWSGNSSILFNLSCHNNSLPFRIDHVSETWSIKRKL